MSDIDEKIKTEKDDPFEFTGKDENCGSDHSSTGSPVPPGVNDDNSKKNKPQKKRKRLLKDVNAPKAPLSGYVRFLNEHREKYREDHPDLAFHEITKILGQKWSSMTQEEKQEYLDEAEKEREQYAKLKEGYQQSAAYKEFQELKKRSKEAEDDGKEGSPPPPKTKKEERPKSTTPKCNGDTQPATAESNTTSESVVAVAQGPRISASGQQIPIFTEQFLEYSRKREADLRQLRKHNAAFEEQNAILNKQIDHMKTVMERVKVEIIDQEKENSNMQTYLEKIRGVLLEKISKLAFPDAIKEAMISDSMNIDKKLSQLVEYISNTKTNEAIEFKRKVKELVNNLDYPTLKK